MADRWIYTPEGKTAFYQREQYIYEPEKGDCLYWESNGWWYEMDGGKAAFWLQEKWIYTPNGKLAFYYG